MKEQKQRWMIRVPFVFDTFGELLKFIRERAGMTQGALARKLKTKQPNIARMERSKKAPSLSMMLKVSKACGVLMEAPSFGCKKCHKDIKECECKS